MITAEKRAWLLAFDFWDKPVRARAMLWTASAEVIETVYAIIVYDDNPTSLQPVHYVDGVIRVAETANKGKE